MDPDRLEKLQEQVIAAQAAGASDEQINARLAELDIPVNSIQELNEAFTKGFRQRVADEALVGGQEIAFGALDEIAGLAAGVGAALVPGGRGFSEAREETQAAVKGAVDEAEERLSPSQRAASQVAGGVLSLGPVSKAARSLGLLRGGENALTAGRATTPFRTMTRAAARGGAAGAVEEGVRGGLRAEGDIPERARAALPDAAVGGVGGVLFGGGSEVVPQVKRAFRSADQVGETLGDELVRTTGRGRTPPSELRKGLKGREEQARETLLGPLEGQPADLNVQGAFVPTGSRFENAPVLLDELTRVGRRNRNAREFVQAVEEFQEGTRRSLPPLEFDAAQSVHQRLRKQVNDAFKAGDPAAIQDVADAADELDELMRQNPNFDQFQTEWHKIRRAWDALDEGKRLAGGSVTADEVKETLEAMPTEEAKRFLKEGMAAEYAARLRRFTGDKQHGLVRDILNSGREFDQKLRKLFPDDEMFRAFKRTVDLEQAAISTVERVKVLAGAIAFIGGGTSLFARMIG